VKGYQDCWTAFNQKKWDEFKLCYAANATVRQLGFGVQSQVSGPAAIAASSQDFAKSFPMCTGRPANSCQRNPRGRRVFLKRHEHRASDRAEWQGDAGDEKSFGLLFAHEIEADLTALKTERELV